MMVMECHGINGMAGEAAWPWKPATEYEAIMSNEIAFVHLFRYIGKILPSSVDRINQASSTTLSIAEQKPQFVHRSDDSPHIPTDG